MAVTNQFLKALGIESDKIDTIFAAHLETVNGLKKQIEEYKADAEKLPELKKELETLKANNSDEYKEKYSEIKKQFEDYKAEIKAKEVRQAKESAYREILKDASLSEEGIKKALKYADFDAIELEDNGKIKDAKAKMKEAKEEWSAYVVTNEAHGANISHPPQGSGGKAYKSKEEIMNISDIAERQKAIAENHELFGF